MFHRCLHGPANKKLAYQLALGNRKRLLAICVIMRGNEIIPNR